MTELLTPALFLAGAVLAALGGLLRRGRPLWALLSALCTGAGLLAGLALGTELDGLLTPLLAVCAVSLLALLRGREGEG